MALPLKYTSFKKISAFIKFEDSIINIILMCARKLFECISGSWKCRIKYYV